MARKIAFWTSTAIVAVMLLFALSYLTGSPQVVEGFSKAGYPQHLRIVLGILKPLAAIILLAPGLPLVKEWAYCWRGVDLGNGHYSSLCGGRSRANIWHAAGSSSPANGLLFHQTGKPSPGGFTVANVKSAGVAAIRRVFKSRFTDESHRP